MDTYRIGSGAGYAGDRIDPAQATLGKERNHPAADQPHHRRHQPQTREHRLALHAFVMAQ